MAPKKKDDDLTPLPDDVQKAKDAVNESARAVGRAAKNSTFLRARHDSIFGKAEEDWDQTLSDVDELDKDFESEDMIDRLKQKFGDVDVRVMQVGPGGVLTDVSDKVNPKDLRPDQIGGVQTPDGRISSLGRNPQSREAAMRLLQEILPGLKLSGGYAGETKATTANSIRLMEQALAEGDKILEHWKK